MDTVDIRKEVGRRSHSRLPEVTPIHRGVLEILSIRETSPHLRGPWGGGPVDQWSRFVEGHFSRLVLGDPHRWSEGLSRLAMCGSVPVWTSVL